MNNFKIISIVGARPQFIKAAALSLELMRCNFIKEIIVHTGQHFDNNMSNIFFRDLKIPAPKYLLNIGGGSHGENTGEMIISIEKILINENPDGVLVYGDTDSTLAAAISAAKLNIPIFHVEAGLRSFNRRMPEEINRILTDHLSDLLFTPTNSSVINLTNEGMSNDKIKPVGDIMYDCIHIFSNEIDNYVSSSISDIVEENGNFILLTLHRAENVDSLEKFTQLIDILSSIKYQCILPIHPRTKKQLNFFGLSLPKNVVVINPVGYFDMIYLQRKSIFIMTDSGGIQKEAFFNKKPCITLRSETEWTELEENGVNFVVGTDKFKFNYALRAIENINLDKFEIPLYGYADTGKKIVDELIIFLNSK